MTDTDTVPTLETIADAIRTSTVGGDRWSATVRGQRVQVGYDGQAVGAVTLRGDEVVIDVSRRAGSVAEICRSVPGVSRTRKA